MGRFKEIDLSRLKRYKAGERISKVDHSQFAKVGEFSLSDFWEVVPDILKARDMKELLDRCESAFRHKKPIILGVGGHVIKCGLAPLINELIRLKAISGVAVNGSVIIHDYEIAMFGRTSEDVAEALQDGSFGMAEDTADGINGLIKSAGEKGLGEAVGQFLAESAPHRELSLLACSYETLIPCTAHIAIGTDIIHQHPSADGAAIGKASLRDFRILCNKLTEINEGGVFINMGSSVIIPEVFLKAVSVVRNLGHPLRNFTTAVFDMNLQYRSMMNVTQRPVIPGGKGFYFVGHHEIMLPLFLLSLRERLQK
jgi:hypothetical protein